MKLTQPLLIILCLTFNCAFGQARPEVIILGAMKKEIQPILNNIHIQKTGTIHKIPYTLGTLEQHPVIVAQTGIGNVNAAIVTSTLINYFHPKWVIFSGIAGALQKNLNSENIVIATKTFDVNFGQYTSKGNEFSLTSRNPIRNAVLPLEYESSSTLVHLAQQLAKKNKHMILGTVATDQHFPNNKAKDPILMNNNVAAKAMEDSGIAQACWLFHIGFISIRAISDNIATKQAYTEKSAETASNKAAEVTLKLVDLIFKQQGFTPRVN